MAESLIPYVVDWNAVRGFFGSRNAPEVERIKSVWKSQIVDNADVFAYLIQNGAPSLGRALDELCMGAPQKPEFASQYVYAFEILCAVYGNKQPNQSVTNVDEAWLQSSLDPVFRAWGLGMVFTSRQLIHGAWPIAIPRPSGLPKGGAIAPDELEYAVMVMRNASPPARLDPRVIAALGEIRGWLETASARSGGLVCFYY